MYRLLFEYYNLSNYDTRPGAGISRIEQQVAWSRLLDRLDGIEYGSDNKFLHQPGIMLGTLELNLKIKKAS